MEDAHKRLIQINDELLSEYGMKAVDIDDWGRMCSRWDRAEIALELTESPSIYTPHEIARWVCQGYDAKGHLIRAYQAWVRREEQGDGE